MSARSARLRTAGRRGRAGRGRRLRWGVGPIGVLLVLTAGACSRKGDETPSPFADCSALNSAAAGSTELPNLRLTCFTGGKQVAVNAIHGPAVINFWASSCGPCRTELPIIQALATEEAGKLTVVGVDTGDRREAGASFAADKQVTLPTLFDENNTLFYALGGRALPMTVFIDAAGRKSVYPLPLTEKTLPEQVRQHTGVTVRQ